MRLSAVVLFLMALTGAATAAWGRPNPPAATVRHDDILFIAFRPNELLVTLLILPTLARHVAEADTNEHAYTRFGAHLSFGVHQSGYEGVVGTCASYHLFINTYMFGNNQLEVGLIRQPLGNGREAMLLVSGFGGASCSTGTGDSKFSFLMSAYDFHEFWRLTLSRELRDVQLHYERHYD